MDPKMTANPAPPYYPPSQYSNTLHGRAMPNLEENPFGQCHSLPVTCPRCKQEVSTQLNFKWGLLNMWLCILSVAFGVGSFLGGAVLLITMLCIPKMPAGIDDDDQFGPSPMIIVLAISMMVFGAIIFIGCTVIPCLIKKCKDCDHICPKCRAVLGTYKRTDNFYRRVMPNYRPTVRVEVVHT
ncbi:LITAF-like zinc ribbon domain-containing protein [Ditylenchus destructor]|nr:LITAF-like zinc ribbon domain-containing protein [Ditylenchus destructor]